jgi:hypothetical protein
MTEVDAIKKSLLLSGFVNGGLHFFFEQTYNAVYIPTDQMTSFENVIEYMQTFAFHRYPTVEERKIYYRTARKLEKFRDKFRQSSSI